jgi:hypothetical protein
MKKNEVKKLKKLRLSLETLRDLTSSDTRTVVGGVVVSSPTYCVSTQPEPCDSE